MSIIIPIDSLSEPQRAKILTDLQVEMPKTKQWVYPYLVDNDAIALPYHYAISNGFLPRPRTDFQSVDIDYNGTLRDYQQEIKKEAIGELKKKCTLLLSLHVGWGKSRFALYLASKLRFKTLILLNRLVLATQWKELIEEVCPTAGVQFIKTKDALDPECTFYIINAINVAKKESGFFSSIGTVIVDEVHLICAKSLFKSLFYLTPRYLIGLSATPYRPDGLGKLMDIYFGEYRITKKLYRKHTVHSIQTGLTIPFEYNWEGRIDWNSILVNQAEHPERNQLIVDVVCYFKERYFLILCKRLVQVELLSAMLKERHQSTTLLIGGCNDFDKDARIVLATPSKGGVGLSHDKLDTLFIASDVEQYYIQYLGRVFRTPEVQPVIFDLVDKNSVLKKHFATRRKVYHDAGGTIKVVKNYRDIIDKK